MRKQSIRLARHHRVDSLLSPQKNNSSDGDISPSLKAGSMNLNEMIEPNEDEFDEDEEENNAELRIPVNIIIIILKI